MPKSETAGMTFTNQQVCVVCLTQAMFEEYKAKLLLQEAPPREVRWITSAGQLYGLTRPTIHFVGPLEAIADIQAINVMAITHGARRVRA